MFPICSPHFLPPRCAFNISGHSRLTFMLDIYSSGRTSRWRCFPLKALSGRKWGCGDGGGGGLASAGGHYSFRGRLLFKFPFLVPFRHTQHKRNQRRHFRPRQETATFPVPGRADPESRWGMGGGGGTQPQRRTLLSLLNSLNIVAAKQVTGTDWRQLTCPGRNPLNSLTPLSTHNASALHLTTRSYSQVSPSPPSPQTNPRHPPPLLPGVICKSVRHYLALLHFHRGDKAFLHRAASSLESRRR